MLNPDLLEKVARQTLSDHRIRHTTLDVMLIVDLGRLARTKCAAINVMARAIRRLNAKIPIVADASR